LKPSFLLILQQFAGLAGRFEAGTAAALARKNADCLRLLGRPRECRRSGRDL
jgi:hypothetical protein